MHRQAARVRVQRVPGSIGEKAHWIDALLGLQHQTHLRVEARKHDRSVAGVRKDAREYICVSCVNFETVHGIGITVDERVQVCCSRQLLELHFLVVRELDLDVESNLWAYVLHKVNRKVSERLHAHQNRP